MRGEHCARRNATCDRCGSAPRARGTPSALDFALMEVRISPACAGNTSSGCRSAVWCTDQPRVRGEHATTERYNDYLVGSAPRARGTLERLPPGGGFERISPACAGNTGRSGSRGSGSPDQPRVRGEHTGPVRVSGWHDGSAPRARGTPTADQDLQREVRISPACAGNTGDPPSQPRFETDQPRVRGEHRAPLDKRFLVYGSAPRARGTLFPEEIETKALFPC